MNRSYIVQTFGCQMNEHDSERIAGLLEADGLERAASPEDADVIVLNTCCIRENADNKLYGHLGTSSSSRRSAPTFRSRLAAVSLKRIETSCSKRRATSTWSSDPQRGSGSRATTGSS